MLPLPPPEKALHTWVSLFIVLDLSVPEGPSLFVPSDHLISRIIIDKVIRNV